MSAITKYIEKMENLLVADPHIFCEADIDRIARWKEISDRLDALEQKACCRTEHDIPVKEIITGSAGGMPSNIIWRLAGNTEDMPCSAFVSKDVVIETLRKRLAETDALNKEYQNQIEQLKKEKQG